MTVAYLQDLAEEFPYVTDTEWPPRIMVITPALAEDWLARVPDRQRLVRNGAVDKFAQDMRTNNWRTNYQPYHFSKEGELLNGQHRLWAIADSRVALKDQLVVFGMDREVYESLDQGTKRTFGDTLKWYGYTNTLVTSAVAHKLYYWNTAKTFRKVGPPPTQHELLKLVRQHRDQMYESIRVGSQVASHVKPLTNSVVALVHLLCSQIPEVETEDVDTFFDRLIDGQGLVVGSPLYALRDKWARNAAKRRPAPEGYVQGAMMIKAWNAYRLGNRVELLSWKVGGASPEDFPQPV
jgi:hypothetical protein